LVNWAKVKAAKKTFEGDVSHFVFVDYNSKMIKTITAIAKNNLVSRYQILKIEPLLL